MKASNMIIISLHGASRSGKGQAAEYITTELAELAKDYTIHTIDFADPLRAATKELLGITSEQLASTDFRKEPLDSLGGQTVVDLMRQLGTEFIRKSFNEMFWVERMSAKLSEIKASEGKHIVLVTDARFITELDLLKEFATFHKMLLVRNPRVSFSNHDSDKLNKAMLNSEYRPYGEKSFTLHNTGTLEDYRNVVSGWCKYLELDLPLVIS